jgi:DNA-directed RNA polymerase subunit E'
MGKIGITCRQPFLGTDEWIREEVEGSSKSDKKEEKVEGKEKNKKEEKVEVKEK